jgi:hypothetical protein
MNSWAVMGRHQKRLPVGKPILVTVGDSTDKAEKKETTYYKKWALGAGWQAGPADNLDSKERKETAKRVLTTHNSSPTLPASCSCEREIMKII